MISEQPLYNYMQKQRQYPLVYVGAAAVFALQGMVLKGVDAAPELVLFT